ncbi:hypothetical protein L211DRAFT_848203 [Terfezia boudieri ATCC MYA-4762]|uniref:Uncharacterized protein n=1 Tax=Terfezia boudieri ATCC MYA-4762 TaxID=1051890 RepID=A0A3N4LVZ2_9PEZI|nr:hypothetical protein L211DRAFT_848203 [Terfezia boudieri ATCC MYA-4762]
MANRGKGQPVDPRAPGMNPGRQKGTSAQKSPQKEPGRKRAATPAQRGENKKGTRNQDKNDPDGLVAQPQPTTYGCYFYEYGQMQYGPLPTEEEIANSQRPRSESWGPPGSDSTISASPQPSQQADNHASDSYGYPPMHMPLSTAYRQVMESIGYPQCGQVPSNLQPQPSPQSMATQRQHNLYGNTPVAGRAAPSAYNSQGQGDNPSAYPYVRPIAMYNKIRKPEFRESASARALKPRVPLATVNAVSKTNPPTVKVVTKAPAVTKVPAHCPNTSYEMIRTLTSRGDEAASMRSMASPTDELVMKLIDPEGRGLVGVLTECMPQPRPNFPETFAARAPLADITRSTRNAPLRKETIACLRARSAAGSGIGMLNSHARNISRPSNVNPLRHVTNGSTEVSYLQAEGVSTQHRMRAPFPHTVGPQIGRPQLPRSFGFTR